MGYYTLHKIRIINEYNTERNLEILLKKIKEISDYQFTISGSEIEDSDWNGGNGSKWYNCGEDMIKISRALPELEIKINGKGEDEEDIWEYILKNGDVKGGMCDDFSDFDDTPNFEEENENNHITIINDVFNEEYEEENVLNLIGYEIEINDSHNKDDLIYRR